MDVSSLDQCVVPVLISRLHQFGKKVLPGIFQGSVLYAGCWKKRHDGRGHSGAGELGRVGNPCSKTQCEAGSHAENGEKTFSQSQVVQCVWKRFFRRPASMQDHLARGAEHNDVCQEESAGSQPLDTPTEDGVARNDVWTVAGKCIDRHHVEPRVSNCMCRVKCHSQYRSSTLTMSGGRIRHWMCCWKAALTSIGTLMVAKNNRATDQFRAVHFFE